MFKGDQKLESRKLLLVDDEADLCTHIAKAMQKSGIECRVAAHGQEALQLIRAEKFHTVLSDIKMPVMDGLTLLKEVRAIGDRDLPFIFMTGFGDKAHALDALRLGAVDFIDKPFRLAEISKLLEHYVEIGVRRRRIGWALEQLKARLNDKQDQELLHLIERELRTIELLFVVKHHGANP